MKIVLNEDPKAACSFENLAPFEYFMFYLRYNDPCLYMKLSDSSYLQLDMLPIKERTFSEPTSLVHPVRVTSIEATSSGKILDV